MIAATGPVITILARLSAVLALIVFVFWQRSYRGCDVLVRQGKPDDRVEVTSEFGLLVLEIEDRQRGTIQPGWCYFQSSLPRRFRADGGLLGFACYKGVKRHFVLLPSTHLLGVTVPYWFLALATAVLPIAFLSRHRLIAMRLRTGLCPVCGYDLRETTARCPECGSAKER